MTWMPEPPDFAKNWNDLVRSRSEALLVISDIGPLTDGQYCHWEKVRHLPAPDNLTSEEHWIGLKLARRQLYVELAMIDVQGEPFRWALHRGMGRALHEVDRKVGGTIGGDSPPTRSVLDSMVLRSLEEESISSSQLEGASTTRRVAREMLSSGREPRSKSERMILNNVEAMRLARDSSDQILTPELIQSIHAEVTQETLPAGESGRYRKSEDAIGIFDEQGRTLLVPPHAGTIEERIEQLCDFANRPDGSDPFVHPVVQSIILHFWLAYIHPFVDGNGRTARTLFYWSMLRNGYWLTEYLSISRVLKSAPGQYKRAFLHTETDENDLTYFIDHQLGVIMKAIDALHRYVEKKKDEGVDLRRFLEQEAARSVGLNVRQLEVMRHARRHPGDTYTIAEHQGLHGIVYQTARTDMLDLVERKLMTQEKIGRSFGFRVPENLAQRMKEEEK